ncbi:MAG: 5-formyltetrahydrofolate cyclo-ligase [Ruminococcaceae bacterium]|nr:5-formyltetrahydrofolate cyclo-ligase [Oscillospiraceae bacterium]
MTLKGQKNALRKFLKAKRKELVQSGKKTALDKKVYENILKSGILDKYNVFLCYVSTEIEVDTIDFIKRCFDIGKIVAVPKCTSDEMTFYVIESFSDISTGMYGIKEPLEHCRLLTNEEMSQSICIVPALAYNKEGFRIGYGKGYYDKFISGYKGATLGLCYSNFIREDIPIDKFDRRIERVITD